MHETIIAKQIIDEAKKHGKVRAITVEVGDLAHLPLQETADTLRNMVPDWEVNMVRKKAKVKCSCGYEGEPKIIESGHDHHVFECPKCGAVPEVVDGKDIVLKEVELED